MTLRPARPLPRRFRRPIAPRTRQFILHQHASRKNLFWKEWMRRSMRLLRFRWTKAWEMLLFWGGMSTVILMVFSLALLIFSPIVHVREISIVRTTSRLDVEQIQQALTPMFGRNLFFLSSREVEAIIVRILPDAETIQVGKKYPSHLTVRIGLQPLVARLHIVHPDVPEITAGTGAITDFLTAGGITITAPLGAEGDLPLLYIDDWGVRPVSGVRLLSPVFLKKMVQAEKLLSEQFGARITRRTIFVRSQEFHVQVNDAFELWFDTYGSSIDAQLARYRAFLQSVNVQEVKQYVDLRLSDRVVYR
ncbi:MAG: FtsQ-type POTRA domain-containing protein [Candidatus Peregrinibacteria bacterium]